MNEDKFRQITNDLLAFAKNRLGYERDPDVMYVRDRENAAALLGRTAHYDPAKKCVTVFISNRHPKDILRSLSHELVHHAQCCRGDLDNTETPPGYAQKDPHMREMEKEAYLKGNMIFRDWEDEAKSTNKLVKLKLIGDNNMSNTNKIKDLIKERVLEILKEKQFANSDELDGDKDGKPKWADPDDPANKSGKKDDSSDDDKPKKKAKKPKKGEVPPQFRKKDKEDKKEEKVEEGGAAQRHDNLDRLRRQDVDRIKEDDHYDDIVPDDDEPYDYDGNEEDKDFELRDMLKKLKKKKKRGPLSALEDLPRDADEAMKFNPFAARKENVEEGNRSPKDKDGKNRYVKHPDKEGVHGVVTAVTDKRTSVRYSDGTQRSHDSMERLAKSTKKAYDDARRTRKESASELTDRKAEQNSINKLNEQRLLNLNKRLMNKLIK